MSEIKIQLSINNAEVRRLMDSYRTSADKAHNSALSRASKKVETELVDRAYEKINLKKKDLRDSISVNGTQGSIKIGAQAISLSRFFSSPPKKRPKNQAGLSVKLWRDRGKVLYEGSFAGFGKGGNFQVFKRVGDARLPIIKLHGKNLRDMWEIPKFSDGIIGVAQDEYSTRFISSFNAFIDKG